MPKRHKNGSAWNPFITAGLATVSLALMVMGGRSCSFVTVQDLTGGGSVLLGNIRVNATTLNTGLLCRDDYVAQYMQSEPDQMMRMSLIFYWLAIVLGSGAAMLAWTISVVMGPTVNTWKAISVLAALCCVWQVPVFLVFESVPCSGYLEQQVCHLHEGAYVLIASGLGWIAVVIATQFLDPPLWINDLDHWRISSSNKHNVAESSHDDDGNSSAADIVDLSRTLSGRTSDKQSSSSSAALEKIKNWCRNCTTKCNGPPLLPHTITQTSSKDEGDVETGGRDNRHKGPPETARWMQPAVIVSRDAPATGIAPDEYDGDSSLADTALPPEHPANVVVEAPSLLHKVWYWSRKCNDEEAQPHDDHALETTTSDDEKYEEEDDDVEAQAETDHESAEPDDEDDHNANDLTSQKHEADSVKHETPSVVWSSPAVRIVPVVRSPMHPVPFRTSAAHLHIDIPAVADDALNASFLTLEHQDDDGILAALTTAATRRRDPDAPYYGCAFDFGSVAASSKASAHPTNAGLATAQWNLVDHLKTNRLVAVAPPPPPPRRGVPFHDIDVEQEQSAMYSEITGDHSLLAHDHDDRCKRSVTGDESVLDDSDLVAHSKPIMLGLRHACDAPHDPDIVIIPDIEDGDERRSTAAAAAAAQGNPLTSLPIRVRPRTLVQQGYARMKHDDDDIFDKDQLDGLRGSPHGAPPMHVVAFDKDRPVNVTLDDEHEQELLDEWISLYASEVPAAATKLPPRGKVPIAEKSSDDGSSSSDGSFDELVNRQREEFDVDDGHKQRSKRSKTLRRRRRRKRSGSSTSSSIAASIASSPSLLEQTIEEETMTDVEAEQDDRGRRDGMQLSLPRLKSSPNLASYSRGSSDLRNVVENVSMAGMNAYRRVEQFRGESDSPRRSPRTSPGPELRQWTSPARRHSSVPDDMPDDEMSRGNGGLSGGIKRMVSRSLSPAANKVNTKIWKKERKQREGIHAVAARESVSDDDASNKSAPDKLRRARIRRLQQQQQHQSSPTPGLGSSRPPTPTKHSRRTSPLPFRNNRRISPAPEPTTPSTAASTLSARAKAPSPVNFSVYGDKPNYTTMDPTMMESDSSIDGCNQTARSLMASTLDLATSEDLEDYLQSDNSFLLDNLDMTLAQLYRPPDAEYGKDENSI